MLKQTLVPILTASLLFSVLPASAAKKVSAAKTEVDGHSFKVVRYNNGSVKVVTAAMLDIQTGQTFVRRDRMRRAVRQATGCEIVDDLYSGGQLIGTLSCDAAPTSKGAQ